MYLRITGGTLVGSRNNCDTCEYNIGAPNQHKQLIMQICNCNELKLNFIITLLIYGVNSRTK